MSFVVKTIRLWPQTLQLQDLLTALSAVKHHGNAEGILSSSCNAGVNFHSSRPESLDGDQPSVHGVVLMII